MTERIRPETVALTLIQHARDSEPEPETYLARVAAAAETIACELAEIRRTMQEDEEKEERE